MAGHVTNLATKLEDPTPIRSWFMSYNVSHWLALKMRMRPLRMLQITWPVNRGSKKLHIWNPRLWFAYSLCNFYLATTTIKGRLLSSGPMLKPFSGEKIFEVPSTTTVQGQKVKGQRSRSQGHAQEIYAVRASALVTLENKRPLIVVVAQ